MLIISSLVQGIIESYTTGMYLTVKFYVFFNDYII